jgi:hypothetical protein
MEVAMYLRVKKSGPRQYLQIVESRWVNGVSRQRVLGTLGRLDELQAGGELDGLMRHLGRFAQRARVVEDFSAGTMEALSQQRIGPACVFERLWQETQIGPALRALLHGRRFEFDVERAVFLTVLHRLFDPGSDRQADRWKADYRIEGAGELELHHLYRAMRWLGDQRERIEEALFAPRRTLFAEGDLVFFDTTSIYFEGSGGQRLGRRGHSKDHRPDRPQMVVGAVMDAEGRPICAPMWPGNTADVKTLRPVVDALRERFSIRSFVIVADRGMMAHKTVEAFERQTPAQGYILGARMRRQKEVSEAVLGRAGRYQEVADNLHVKEVRIEGRRYILCRNPEEAEYDAAARQAILDSLQEKLKSAPGTLIGNRGYRRFVSVRRGAVTLDEAKIRADARYDGKYVLRTNTDLPAEEVAKRYKELWRVERLFRDTKSLLDTRPIFHNFDATICGHVFVSFLALLLRHELDRRQSACGTPIEWADIRRDLDALEEIEVRHAGRHWWLRTPLREGAAAAFRAAGVAIPPSLREA